MKITHLDKIDLYHVLARTCEESHARGEECFAISQDLGCPFELSDGSHPCDLVRLDDWEKVFEGKPRYRFGDKVTHHIDFPVRAVFSAYKDSRHSGEAYVLFDGGSECHVVFVRNLKAGWE